jgi:RNA polymerase sigma factor (TIGR02999 family)
MSSGNVTLILDALERGERQAAEELLPMVYAELRRLAEQKMSHEAAGHTLQPTALVHEAYMRLVEKGDARCWDSRGHFYAAAAEAMRRILIESARRRHSQKRGGDAVRFEFSEEIAAGGGDDSRSLLALDEALERLKQQDAQAAQLVLLRYFGGLTIDEAAASLGISPRTAKRNWSFARAWLQREVERGMERE